MLKKALLIFLGCLWLSAYAADSHKQRMIEYVNKGEYAQAAEELREVKLTWHFDINEKGDSISVSRAFEFYHYLDSIHYDEEVRQYGIMSYVMKECDAYAHYYFEKLDGVYNREIISYLEWKSQAVKIIFDEPSDMYISSLRDLNMLGSVLYKHVYDNPRQVLIDRYLKVQELCRQLYGEKHSEYIKSLIDLGECYLMFEDYEESEKYYLQALEFAKALYGSAYNGDVSDKLGWVYDKMKNPEKAEFYYLESLEAKRIAFGEADKNYFNLLVRLGNWYDEHGNNERADYYYTKYLEILESQYKKDPEKWREEGGFEMLEWIAPFYGKIGNYSKEESCLLFTYNREKNIYLQEGSNAWSLLQDIEALGCFYLRNPRDYSKAEQYFREALEIAKTSSEYGESHPQYAYALKFLGKLHQMKKDYKAAEACFLQALDILVSAFGDEKHTNCSYILMDLGNLYAETKDYAKADAFYSRAQALDKKMVVPGEQYDYERRVALEMGWFMVRQNDYTKAEPYFLQVIELSKSEYGEHSVEYAGALENLGWLYETQKNYALAFQYYSKACQIEKDLYLESLDFMTEEQRIAYWNKLRWHFKEYSDLVWKSDAKDSAVAEFGYNNELFTKGLSLRSSEVISRSIQESNNPELIEKWNQLTALKTDILHVQDGTSPQNERQYQQQAESLEKEILRLSTTYRDNQALMRITWDSVRNHLGKNEVALEFLNNYAALLIRYDSKHPIFVDAHAPYLENMESEKRINELFKWNSQHYFDGVNGADGFMVKDYGKSQSYWFWQDIKKHVKKGETVYFAPKDNLHVIPVEALAYDKKRTLSDVYNLVRVSSTREIITRKWDMTHTTASLYGGIQYNMEADELLAESEAYSTMNLLASRGIESDTLNRGSVKYLAGTKREVENINRMLRDYHLQVRLFTSTAANEESFKALSGTHQNILHIATHGFFWPDSTAKKKDFFAERMMRMGDDAPAEKVIDPLSRCGLLFAGANLALQGHSNELPEGVQDGILTAKEISLLDLRDADLVVLSACETGKGEISGDGVFGLQRAFKMAGVQTIIMSLWPVNDSATQMLMTEFYRNWIVLGQPKRTAFRNAQNAVREEFEEPVYWAGFIMLD